MKKTLFIFVLMIALISVFAITASAKMVVSDEYIADNGEFYAEEIDGSGYFAFDASYLSTDGTTKTATFYYKGSYFRDAYVLDGIYLPSDFDLTQVILTPDGYVEASGASGTVGYTTGAYAIPISTITSVTVGEGSLTLVGEQSVRMIFEAISFPRHLFCISKKGNFGGCDKLSTVTYNGREAIPKTAIFSSELTEINSFGGSGNHTVLPNIERIIFEPRTKTLNFGQYAISRGIIKEIVFGAGTYSLYGQDSITHQYNESGVGQLERIVVEDGVVINGTIQLELKRKYDVVFIGDATTYESAKSGFEGALTQSTGVLKYENPCYLDGHTVSTDFVLAYPNGYGSVGVKYYPCTSNGCPSRGSESEIPALIVPTGYSTRLDGTGGIMAGFQLNQKAINDYSTFIGENIEMSLVIANANSFTDTLFDENGKITANGLQVEIEDTGFSVINISIDGFNVDIAKTLVITSFISVKCGEETSIVQATSENYITKTIGSGENATRIKAVTLYTVAKITDVNTLILKGEELTVE